MAVLCEIYSLSNNTVYNGWCIKSKESIADTLDLSKPTVLKIIDTLIEMEYVDREPHTKGLKPTDKIRAIAQETENFMILIKTDGYVLASSMMYDAVKILTDGKETLPVKNLDPAGKETLPEIGKETLPKMYSTDNNTDNQIKEINKEKEFVKTQRLWYRDQVEQNIHMPKILEYKAFCNYIFSENGSGKPILPLLKIPNQVTYDDFTKLCAEADIRDIYEKVDIMLNTPKYAKGKQYVHLTILNWLRKK